MTMQGAPLIGLCYNRTTTGRQRWVLLQGQVLMAPFVSPAQGAVAPKGLYPIPYELHVRVTDTAAGAVVVCQLNESNDESAITTVGTTFSITVPASLVGTSTPVILCGTCKKMSIALNIISITVGTGSVPTVNAYLRLL